MYNDRITHRSSDPVYKGGESNLYVIKKEMRLVLLHYEKAAISEAPGL